MDGYHGRPLFATAIERCIFLPSLPRRTFVVLYEVQYMTRGGLGMPLINVSPKS